MNGNDFTGRPSDAELLAASRVALATWDTVRPFLITGEWAGIVDAEQKAIGAFVDAMDALAQRSDTPNLHSPVAVSRSTEERE